MYSSDRLIKKTSNINVIFFSFCVRPSAPCPEESCPSDKLVTTAIALKVLEIAKQFFFLLKHVPHSVLTLNCL